MGQVLRYDEVDAGHPFYARYLNVVPGVPGRCPECEDFGFIDNADIARNYQNQHCRGCSTRWSYVFDDEGRILEVHGLPRSVRPTVDTVLDLRAPQPLEDTPPPAPRKRRLVGTRARQVRGSSDISSSS